MPALPRATRDPIRAHMEASHDDGHRPASGRLAVLDATELTARRAKQRLHNLRALMRFLNRTGPSLHALERRAVPRGARAPDGSRPGRAP
jgi:hypothetical protein